MSDEPTGSTVSDQQRVETLVPALEAVLFAAPEPLGLNALLGVFGDGTDPEDVRTALEILRDRTAGPGRGVQLVEVAGGWQFMTRPELFPAVQKIAKKEREERLTPAGIETLAVVAYKQPVTRAEVDAIRGAASGPILRTLMDRGLVKVGGRADLPGAPFTYVTTKHFLQHFGLRSVKDLPDQKDLARLLLEHGRPVGRPAVAQASAPPADVAEGIGSPEP